MLHASTIASPASTARRPVRRTTSGRFFAPGRGNRQQTQRFSRRSRRGTESLDYMHARFYNPQVGRFLSTDPSKRSWEPKQPQSWNRFTYVRGNPLVHIDPDGEVGIRCDACGSYGPTDLAVGQLARDLANDTPEQRKVAAALLAPAGVTIAASTLALLPEAVVAVFPRLGSLFLSPQVQGAAAGVAAGLAEQPSPANFGVRDDVSRQSLKHISKHLGRFQGLDSKLGLRDVVSLGKQIAGDASNLVGTPGGRKVFESTVRIGGTDVTVRVVLNTNQKLRSVFIKK